MCTTETRDCSLLQHMHIIIIDWRRTGHAMRTRNGKDEISCRLAPEISIRPKCAGRVNFRQIERGKGAIRGRGGTKGSGKGREKNCSRRKERADSLKVQKLRRRERALALQLPPAARRGKRSTQTIRIGKRTPWKK